MRTIEELIRDAQRAIYDHAFLLSYFYEENDLANHWADKLFDISKEMEDVLKTQSSFQTTREEKATGDT